MLFGMNWTLRRIFTHFNVFRPTFLVREIGFDWLFAVRRACELFLLCVIFLVTQILSRKFYGYHYFFQLDNGDERRLQPGVDG